jgi:hypothetical protein
VRTLIVTEFMTLDGVVEAIFPQDREKISLELADLVRYDSGVLLQIYRPTS